MLQTNLSEPAGNNYPSRRRFLQLIGAGAVATEIPTTFLQSATAYAASKDENRDLTARIREFWNTQGYPSVHEYAARLKIRPVAASSEITDFLRGENIVGHINKLSAKYNIPSYLLAAIVAEERTPTGLIDRLFHGTGERAKSSLGYDTSMGKGNVKMSIAAYYLGMIDETSQDEFAKLSKAEKEQIKQYLEDPLKNLEIAAQYVRDLKRNFLGWNEVNKQDLPEKARITSENIDTNPLALLQIANGYSGGEDMLHKPPTGKARRVLAMLTGNKFIFELYGGRQYHEQLSRLKSRKNEDDYFLKMIMEVRKYLGKGYESRDNKQFGIGYGSFIGAIESARNGFEDADRGHRKDWEVQFLAHWAYAHAAAGRLLVNALEHNVRVTPADKEMTESHYNAYLKIYQIMKSRGVDIERIEIKPKPLWSKKLPPIEDIGKVLKQLRNGVSTSN